MEKHVHIIEYDSMVIFNTIDAVYEMIALKGIKIVIEDEEHDGCEGIYLEEIKENKDED